MTSFADLALIEPIHRAVRDDGSTTPTPIKERSIPSLLAGKDLLGCAQTGTGKTAAFTLPILQRLSQAQKFPSRNSPRALILAPTRELAAQIAQSIKVYGKYLRLASTVIFGGVGQGPQVHAMNRGVDVLVATPGRLLDLMNQGFVRLNEVEVFVLDEADRMLDMGFIPDIKKVIQRLPPKRQSLFFSATLEPAVIVLARTLVHDPVHVTIEPEKPTVDRIMQSTYFVNKEHKDPLLLKLLSDPAFKRVIVFTQMKHVANKVAMMLNHSQIRTEAIHGNKSQGARTASLEAFRRGRARVLVATDIAARGIDIDGVTHVINYELPNEPETYIHRIGRTARAGEQGHAISFCSANERDYLRMIEHLIRKPIAVVIDHPFHSDLAMRATGAAARPPPKGGRFGGQRSGPRAPGRFGQQRGPSRFGGQRGHGGPSRGNFRR